MTALRRRRRVVGIAIGVGLLVAGALTGEAVARGQIESRLASAADTVQGVTTSLAGGPALLQVALGRIDAEMRVPDNALDSLVNCRADRGFTVHAVDGALIVATERTVRGMTLPVEVRLVAREQDGAWVVVADSVSAGGISLPATRALKMLGGTDGPGSSAVSRLLDGIPLPSDGRFTVTAVHFVDGAAILDARTAFASPSTGEGAGIARFRECSENPEG
ncbi:hypothetical protein [Microbacterium sp. T32]|uniref:hypothetical protein n=1 Tax=Microbacterium sp. T32 TaxID=1776083 RepID=UPI0007AB2FA6|nr:hypothetical protein [Microbacterium sp. T32]KZE40413.1 hypothetical protein AVW09_15265 [Microbacterium sp. T32]